MSTLEGIRIIWASVIIGGICLAYNKPISNEIARVSVLPIKWVIGEKHWLIKIHQYLTVCVRFTLYWGVLVALVGIVLTLGTLLHFY